jgi:ABC-type oligopeptide transport system ATPase subunit
MMDKEVLLEVKQLKKHFSLGRNETLKAVDGISFSVYIFSLPFV